MVGAGVAGGGRVGEIRRGAGERAVGGLGEVEIGECAARRGACQGNRFRAGGGDDLGVGDAEAGGLGGGGDGVFEGVDRVDERGA